MTDLNDFGSAGLLYIGADITSSTVDDWHRAGDALQQQKDDGITRRYYDQSYIDALERGDIWISQAWSGDIFQARASGYPNLEFVVPQEGVMHWTDNMMIPMHAANPQSAIMWMDFYYQPEVAARVADWVNYITPVPDAKEIIAGQLDDPGVAKSQLVFPTPDIQARDYRVFRHQDEFDTWNGIFGPIATN